MVYIDMKLGGGIALFHAFGDNNVFAILYFFLKRLEMFYDEWVEWVAQEATRFHDKCDDYLAKKVKNKLQKQMLNLYLFM